MGYSLKLAARILLYESSHRQDNTYHGLSYTSRGALGGTRKSSWVHHEGSIRRPIAPCANALTTELHLAPRRVVTETRQNILSHIERLRSRFDTCVAVHGWLGWKVKFCFTVISPNRLSSERYISVGVSIVLKLFTEAVKCFVVGLIFLFVVCFFIYYITATYNMPCFYVAVVIICLLFVLLFSCCFVITFNVTLTTVSFNNSGFVCYSLFYCFNF